MTDKNIYRVTLEHTQRFNIDVVAESLSQAEDRAKEYFMMVGEDGDELTEVYDTVKAMDSFAKGPYKPEENRESKLLKAIRKIAVELEDAIEEEVKVVVIR